MVCRDPILEENKNYWTDRAPGYSEVNRLELATAQRQRWKNCICEELTRRFPDRPLADLQVLEGGTGPGFFAILLRELGCAVTAIDLTRAMLAEAKENAGPLADEICFMEMNAEALSFAPERFDAVISRNLTWNLPHPDRAYAEWTRVLKKGGVLLNFDANYGITDFSNVEDLPENHAHNMLGNEMMRECEEIKRQLPISSYSRPAWDLETLGAMSLKEFHVDLGISSRIYLEKDEFYNPTPLFMLRTVK